MQLCQKLRRLLFMVQHWSCVPQRGVRSSSLCLCRAQGIGSVPGALVGWGGEPRDERLRAVLRTLRLVKNKAENEKHPSSGQGCQTAGSAPWRVSSWRQSRRAPGTAVTPPPAETIAVPTACSHGAGSCIVHGPAQLSGRGVVITGRRRGFAASHPLRLRKSHVPGHACLHWAETDL